MAEWSLADSWGGIALLFLAFAGFFLGALGYGALLRRWVLPRAGLLTESGDSFLLASLFLWALATLLAGTHALLLFPRWAYALIFLPGFLAALRPLAGFLQAAWMKRRLGLFVAAFVFLVRGLGAALPASHGDPLLYHLLGPRLWAEEGGFVMHPLLPNALLASSWECLYLWPQVLWLLPKPLFGLVEAQVFSQWLHLFLAWGGCALLVMRIFRDRVRAEWLPLLGLAALFVAGVQWTAPLAKNDAGIAFWALGAVAFFREGLRERSFRKALLSGIFAGLAISGKVTALLSLAPLLAALFLAERPWKDLPASVRALAAWGAGTTLGALPIYARNYLLSGNPFFPMFPRLFPSRWMSHTWEMHFSQVQPSNPWRSLPSLWARFPELLRESPWIVGSALLLLAAAALPFFRRKREKSATPAGSALLVGSFLAYAIFATTQSKDIELRYLGASLMLLAAGGVVYFLALLELLPSERARKRGAALLLLALLAGSRLPTHLLWKVWKSDLGTHLLNTHAAGEAKSWVRAHAGAGLTVLVADNETYYLTPVRITVLTEYPPLDAATYAETDFAGFVEKVCAISHARYLLDARPGLGLAHRFGAQALAPGKVFEAQGAVVYELAALERSLGRNKTACH